MPPCGSYTQISQACKTKRHAIHSTALHWSSLRRFCPSCGSPAITVNAGYKVQCIHTIMPRLAFFLDVYLALLVFGKQRISHQSSYTVPPVTLQKLCSNSKCRSRSEVCNFSFPRSDPTVITLVLDSTLSKCLLVCTIIRFL